MLRATVNLNGVFAFDNTTGQMYTNVATAAKLVGCTEKEIRRVLENFRQFPENSTLACTEKPAEVVLTHQTPERQMKWYGVSVPELRECYLQLAPQNSFQYSYQDVYRQLFWLSHN
jgi:hypothetical protein